MNDEYRHSESLPGDFSFKVTDDIHPTGSDDTIPLQSVLLYLGIAAVLSGFLFFSTFSLHAKLHFFILFVAIGTIVYNNKVYFPSETLSYLDTYRVYVVDSETGIDEEVERFGKWRRLLWSVAEPPNPEHLEDKWSEPSRSTASVRTLIEWILIVAGVLWSSYDFFQYYFATNGPYFHDIFGHYMMPLVLGVIFWFLYWIKIRVQDDLDDVRLHVEALNFFICRWLIGYGIIWCAIALIFIIDA